MLEFTKGLQIYLHHRDDFLAHQSNIMKHLDLDSGLENKIICTFQTDSAYTVFTALLKEMLFCHPMALAQLIKADDFPVPVEAFQNHDHLFWAREGEEYNDECLFLFDEMMDVIDNSPNKPDGYRFGKPHWAGWHDMDENLIGWWFNFDQPDPQTW
jgi:hypothetical protein